MAAQVSSGVGAAASRWAVDGATLFVTLDGGETWQKYGHVDYDDGELTPLLDDIG